MLKRSKIRFFTIFGHIYEDKKFNFFSFDNKAIFYPKKNKKFENPFFDGVPFNF